MWRSLFVAATLTQGVYADQEALRPLDYGPAPATLISSKIYIENDGNSLRNYEDLILNSPAGEIRITISRPQKEGDFSCVFVISGLETGRKSLKLIPNHGDQILISYEYPQIIKELKKTSILFHFPAVRKACLSVPAQINAVLRFLNEQPYCKKCPVSMIGFSFGTIFLPPAMHLGQSQNLDYGPTVFGYGGAGLCCLIRANLPGPQWVRSFASKIGAAVFHPLEAELHLPYIHGEFLVINGVKDRQIPLDCAKRMQDMVPPPKEIINLDTDHLQPDDHELLVELIAISREWLGKERS